MNDAICKGSWALGSACGHCARCADEAREIIPKMLAAYKTSAMKVARAVSALGCAPKPNPRGGAEWMVDYMDWYFQTRQSAVNQ